MMRRLRLVSIVLVALLVVGWVARARLLPRLVAAKLSRVTTLDVSVGRVAVGWTTRRLVLHDVEAHGPDGSPVMQVRSLLLGWRGGGDASWLDGAIASGVSLFDRPAMDGRVRRWRVVDAADGVAIDGVFEIGAAVVSIAGGRLDVATGAASARRVVLRNVALDAVPTRWPVVAERLVVTAGRVGRVAVDRLIADGVGTDPIPARLRAQLRYADGTARVRWNAAAPRLDVRLANFPLGALVEDAFPEARLSGGVATGRLHVGRAPGLLGGRVRIGPTRLERGGETWLGWTGAGLHVRDFDVATRRLLGGALALTRPVMIVRRGVEGIWPIAGWASWLAADARRTIGDLWSHVESRFTLVRREEAPRGVAAVAMVDGTLVVVDDTMDPPARLTVHDLNARGHYDLTTRVVEARLGVHVDGGGYVVATLVPEPRPRATLTVSDVPIVAFTGWSAVGRGLFGIPLGRVLTLAAPEAVLDLYVDVAGDPSEKRFGLATRVFDALVEMLRDRVTSPLLAAAELSREGNVESLRLPVLAVDAEAGMLTGATADAADRVAVLLRHFPELSARLDGRFAEDEPALRGEARATTLARHLTALGFGDQVVVGPVASGPPGVAIVLGGRIS